MSSNENWWETSGHEPVLVTGSIRSGTTFVGKVLSFGSEYVYINEPFNLHNNAIYDLGWKRQYQYINEESGKKMEYQIAGAFRLSGNIFVKRNNLLRKKGLRNIYHSLNRVVMGLPQRVIVKDPIALSSANWIAKTFHAKVVITMRHPASYVLSLKKLGWCPTMNSFLDQPDLMHDFLMPYKAEMEALKDIDKYDLRLAILSWNIANSMAYQMLQTNNDIILVRHEDISANPVEEFCKLFKKLNQPFTQDIINFIEENSSSDNPISTLASDPHSIAINSKANTGLWRQLLSNSEIEQIKEGTKDIFKHFYTPEEW